MQLTQPSASEDIQAENLVLLEQVPDSVKKFIVQLHQGLSSSNASVVGTLYERTFGQLTNEYFKAEEWPTAEVIAPLVHDGAP